MGDIWVHNHSDKSVTYLDKFIACWGRRVSLNHQSGSGLTVQLLQAKIVSRGEKKITYRSCISSSGDTRGRKKSNRWIKWWISKKSNFDVWWRTIIWGGVWCSLGDDFLGYFACRSSTQTISLFYSPVDATSPILLSNIYQTEPKQKGATKWGGHCLTSPKSKNSSGRTNLSNRGLQASSETRCHQKPIIPHGHMQAPSILINNKV
jgi:hypothetical protein